MSSRYLTGNWYSCGKQNIDNTRRCIARALVKIQTGKVTYLTPVLLLFWHFMTLHGVQTWF